MNTFDKVYRLTRPKSTPDTRSGPVPSVLKNIYYKIYPRFTAIALPEPKQLTMPLGMVLANRRSVRKRSGRPLTLDDISALLFHSAGISQLPGKDLPFPGRTYPSAGARYPLELYCCVFNAGRKLPAGTYHYNVQQHALERLPVTLSNRDFLGFFHGNNRLYAGRAGMGVFMTAAYQRTEIKYGNAAFRYIFLEAGHLMQNLYLTSRALGIGWCAIGEFDEEKILASLHLDWESERVLYAGLAYCG